MAYLQDRYNKGLHGGLGKVAEINPLVAKTRKGTFVGDLARSDFAGAMDSAKSHKGDKAKNLAAQMESKENEQYGKNQEYAKTLAGQDQSYLDSMKGNVGKYQTDLDTLRGEAETSQKDASATYSNQIQPRMKGLMEQAQTNSQSAMSLNDAMDPNNKVAKSTRDLYEQQAQNEGRSGLADAGVLSALGAQNMASQLGGAGPMTGGQMAALMGQNQAQSGAAYARTLQRGQQLRDTGLNKGFERSDIAYGQGLDAQDRYRRSVGDYEGASDRQLGRDTSFRGERGGYSGQTYGLQQQMNDATRGAANAGTQRDMTLYNTHMGGQQANLGSQIAGINAEQAADAAQKTAAMQTVGTVAGSYFGGPAGGAAGGAAGKAAGQAAAPDANAIPQYGNYGAQNYSQPSNFVEQGSQNPAPQYGYGGPSAMAGESSTGAQGLGLTEDPYQGRTTMGQRMASR